MDNDLVDFAMQCPVGLKLNNLAEVLRINENEPGIKKDIHFQKLVTASILRDMMTRHLSQYYSGGKRLLISRCQLVQG